MDFGPHHPVERLKAPVAIPSPPRLRGEHDSSSCYRALKSPLDKPNYEYDSQVKIRPPRGTFCKTAKKRRRTSFEFDLFSEIFVMSENFFIKIEWIYKSIQFSKLVSH